MKLVVVVVVVEVGIKNDGGRIGDIIVDNADSGKNNVLAGLILIAGMESFQI